MQTNNIFSSKSLQSLQEEAEPIVAQHLKKIQDVSNDIKAIEDQFKNSAIPFTLILALSSSQKSYTEQSQYDFMPRSDIIEYEDICIVWGKTKDGNYRFSKNIYTTKIEVSIDSLTGDVSSIINQYPSLLTYSKPLIETKSHFRLQIEKELPYFYENILQILKKGIYDETEVVISKYYNFNDGNATCRLKNKRISLRKQENDLIPF